MENKTNSMENKIKDSTENTTNNELGYMTDEMMMKSIDTPKKKLQYFWDYYKWRQMRSNGVEEKYITGDATDREKFQKWAETLEMAIGNPLYHWSHLELKRYLGYDGYLNGETAEEVWNLCNEQLLRRGDLQRYDLAAAKAPRDEENTIIFRKRQRRFLFLL